MYELTVHAPATNIDVLADAVKTVTPEALTTAKGNHQFHITGVKTVMGIMELRRLLARMLGNSRYSTE